MAVDYNAFWPPPLVPHTCQNTAPTTCLSLSLSPPHSLYLFKLGLAPQIQDLYGKVDFTGECVPIPHSVQFSFTQLIQFVIVHFFCFKVKQLTRLTYDVKHDMWSSVVQLLAKVVGSTPAGIPYTY